MALSLSGLLDHSTLLKSQLASQTISLRMLNSMPMAFSWFIRVTFACSVVCSSGGYAQLLNPVWSRSAATGSPGNWSAFASFRGGDGILFSDLSSSLTAKLGFYRLPFFSEKGLSVVSNPASGDRWRNCFLMASDGQVYEVFESDSPTGFSTAYVGTGQLPVSLEVDRFSNDSVQAVVVANVTFVFARSQTNTSRLFYTCRNNTLSKAQWSKWLPIGEDGEGVEQDAFAVVNTFLGRIEVFAVLSGGALAHTWQSGVSQFDSKWHKLGVFPPKFDSAPTAHSMGHSVFNGVLEVFARGTDGVVYRIWQTTCDKVKNPWGPCTWNLYFEKLGSSPPSSPQAPNPLVTSSNLHLGVEVFVVSRDGQLYHIWESERGGKWSDWQAIGYRGGIRYAATPSITTGVSGWWEVVAVGEDNMTYIVSQAHVFSVAPSAIPFGHNITVNWVVPMDEATSKDWIGLYPKGTDNDFYVDFSYVGGKQNPLEDPVPEGALNFTVTLPNGAYEVRYLVNREYTPVMGGNITVSNATNASEWLQLYRGMARGLGVEAFNFEKCVKDGNLTVETFRDAFKAFESRDIIEGLHLIAQGLTDLRDALVACDETAIVQDLTKFIEDLISCTEGSCEKFVIDIGKYILILYERHYEIYGDIRCASNGFKIDAYEQAGIDIGRVTAACIKNPTQSI